jgi:phosphoribosylaminoimidazole-succinocarboxamide synthase
VPLPDGLHENEKLPHPIITPTTKAEQGSHDQDISKEEILSSGLVNADDYALLERYALQLFERGSQIAAEKGLILVDTKYEFGKHDQQIFLIDEVHTPDSSRYFYADGYEDLFKKGLPQKQLSKEFVREWLMQHGFHGKSDEKIPEMTDDVVLQISNRYIELYEHLLGESFVKDESSEDVLQRIETNITQFLSSYLK